MHDQYSPIPVSREVRELRRELHAAREEIDRLHNYIRDLENELCLAQPRYQRRDKVHEYLYDRMAQMPGASVEEMAQAIGTGVQTILKAKEVLAARERGEENFDG